MFTENKQAMDIISAPSVRPAGDSVLRRFAAFIILVSLILAIPLEAGAANKSKNQGSGENPKYAAIVVDSDTGTIISQSSPDKTVHPASLTKVMTLLLLFEAMESGNVRLNDKILISARAAAQSPSKIGLPAGSSIRVEDAILAIVTKSANDISYAVAEHLAGSEGRFAERMTYRARSIGMPKTTFRNAHGLHNPGQVTTARDMATLARYVIVRYPNYYRYFSTKQFTYRGKTYTNHNRLMQSYPGMDGFKTGFINASGFNLIASAKHGDKRLIGVVFGGRSWKSRNDKMASLLDEAFSKGPTTRYAGTKIPPAQTPTAAVPVPTPKPVMDIATITPPQPPSSVSPLVNTNTGMAFTSLDPLGGDKKIMIGSAEVPLPGAVIAPAPLAVPDVTGDAIAKVQTAMNRGDYSEVTGEGDFDAANARRVETGLLAAAVYKGEARYQKKTASATKSASGMVLDAPKNLALPDQATAYQPVSVPPQHATAISDLWSVQIGAYTSRVATDDALRRAMTKLPQALNHASPIVAPLETTEGLLFRARLGNLSQSQANEACRYFRDCLAVSPR